MNDSEKKDRILVFFNIEKAYTGTYSFSDLNELVFKKAPESDATLRYLAETIIKDGYLQGSVARFVYDYSLTPFIEKGGYVGKDAREKKKEELQEVIYKKTKWEGKLAKWQVILFWVITPITLVGSILGIIAFLRK